MIERAAKAHRIRGRISRRLLVNALVDPTEVAPHLPLGVRPHLIDDGTVVGCCLLELEHLRPSWVPRAVGVSIRTAAHRISVEVPGSAGFGLRVVAANGGEPASASDSVGRACIDATLGLSRRFDSELQCVEMTPAHRRSHSVDIESLDSDFLASATPAPSYLMSDVDVTWSAAPSTPRMLETAA